MGTKNIQNLITQLGRATVIAIKKIHSKVWIPHKRITWKLQLYTTGEA